MNNEVKRFKVVNVLLVTFVLMLIVSVGLMLCQKWFIYTVNHTTSLSGKVYVIKKGEPVQKGDLVGFLWQGQIKYPKDVIFVKIVSGVEGDRIVVKDRDVFINDKYIGRAKKQSADGKLQLEVISSQVIPKNEIFVSTPHKDSLDSRYAKVGTINKQYILGKAYEIF